MGIRAYAGVVGKRLLPILVITILGLGAASLFTLRDTKTFGLVVHQLTSEVYETIG
jgi:hypothetical protein